MFVNVKNNLTFLDTRNVQLLKKKSKFETISFP